MKMRMISLGIVVLMLAAAATAEDDEDEKKVSAEKRLAIAKAMGPSLVQAEFTLKYDKGEAPRGSGWAGRFSAFFSYGGGDLSSLVEEERPYEVPAFLISPTEAITPDPMMHARFIESISVRFGDEVVGATPKAYGIDQGAIVLKLDKPLKGAKPLEFNAEAEPPYMAVVYHQSDGAWTITVISFPTTASTTREGRKYLSVPSYCVMVDSEGVPVGMSMKDEIPVDDSWKGSPAGWPVMSAGQMADALERLERTFTQGVFLVRLNFRSPKKTSRYSYRGEEATTQRHALGGLIDERTILVLADMKPKVTGRLEQITAMPQGRDPVAAEFVCTLKDYGAFVARLTEPLPGPLVFHDGKITEFRNKLLVTAEVKIEGEKTTVYYLHNRVVSFDIGWKRRLFPEVRGRDENLVLFDTQGSLVAFPIAKREKVSAGRYGYRSGYSRLTPAAHMIPVKADLAKHADPSNIPLTEEQESRLAWLGVVLQPLNAELARINKVSHLTRDGSIGALVSYVYDGSPADKGKIQVGDVLIRIHSEDLPKPIDISMEEYGFAGRPFPWHRLDELPEHLFDDVPRPWPPAENTLTRTLTDLGFAKKFTLEMSRDGEVSRREFTVVESPPHYDSADKHKSEPLGLTVKDLTYELRRYFQKSPEDLGVIVSKIEQGSKASVSGLKPYEIITQVNDQPVKTVKDFEKLIAAGGELRLSVKRMTKGRVVKIKMESPTTKPAAVD